MQSDQATVLVPENITELKIEESVNLVREIINTLEDGDVSLSEAKELREQADTLLDHVEGELDVGDGEIKRVEA
jgi:exodeoxyribonuclease VII small subunit